MNHKQKSKHDNGETEAGIISLAYSAAAVYSMLSGRMYIWLFATILLAVLIIADCRVEGLKKSLEKSRENLRREHEK